MGRINMETIDYLAEIHEPRTSAKDMDIPSSAPPGTLCSNRGIRVDYCKAGFAEDTVRRSDFRANREAIPERSGGNHQM